MPCWCPRKIGMPFRRPFSSYRCPACVNPFGWDSKPLSRNVRKSPPGERLESCLHKASAEGRETACGVGAEGESPKAPRLVGQRSLFNPPHLKNQSAIWPAPTQDVSIFSTGSCTRSFQSAGQSKCCECGRTMSDRRGSADVAAVWL